MSDTFDSITVNEINFADVCKMYLTEGTSGIADRLGIKFFKGSAEIELEPAETFDTISRIVSQIQLMGRNRITNEKQWRKRGSVTIFNDSAGGEALYIDSTLTGDAPLNESAMPMVLRLQHDTHGNPDIDVVFHPSDNSLELKDYSTNTFVRKTILDWIKTSNKSIDQL